MTNDHDQLDPAEALMREVGAQLRRVRVDRGEELEEVAQHLRIKSVYLFGIEQGDLSKMPGRTYALGFLRSYADYLGFDGDDLIVQIKSTVANLTDRTRLRIRTPLPESRVPKTPILVISLAAIVAVYGGWSYLNRNGQLAVETVAEVPADLRSAALDALEGEPLPAAESAAAATGPGDEPVSPADAGPPTAAPGVETADATAPGAGSPGATAGALAEPPAAGPLVGSAAAPANRLAAGQSRPAPEPEPEPQAAAGSSPAPPAPAAGPQALRAAAPAETTPSAAPAEDLVRRAAALRTGAETPADGAEAPAGGVRAPAAGVNRPGEAGLAVAPDLLAAARQVYEAENTDARVVLRALDRSWIQISSLNGDYSSSATLQQGDVFLVPNRSDLELWTGNAGGIEVILDGAVLAPVGNPGAVVREVPLDPPSLRARFGRP